MRVTVSRMATASAISPATWPVSTGLPRAKAEESATGWALRPPVFGLTAEAEPDPREGVIAGNRPEALPAPTSELEMNEFEAPVEPGIGPTGILVPGVVDADGVADDVGEAAAAVTATVSAAEGGVHLAEVTMLAVAVSVTELTEVAGEATGIWTFSVTGCLSDTEPTTHVAAPLPLAQPPVKAAFWLDGLAVRATDTSEAGPFWVETCTT